MRLYGDDILTKLQCILNAKLNTTLTAILTDKDDLQCPLVKKINVGYAERQYPECLITLNDSKIEPDTLSLNVDDTPEEFPVDVIIVIKDNTAKTYLRQEYYIKALQQTLHGYTDEDITWIVVTDSIRANMYTEQKETLRVVGVSITIRTL